MGGADFHDAAKDVEQLSERIEMDVDRNMYEGMAGVAGTAQTELEREGSVSTNTLLDSIEHNSQLSSSTISAMERVADAYSSHEVIATAPYAAYVEYGTGSKQRGAPESGRRFKSPSVPPYHQIKAWVERENITARSDKYKTNGTTDTERLAGAIADEIAQYGTAPHPYMRPAWQVYERQLKQGHKDGVHLALRRTF